MLDSISKITHMCNLIIILALYEKPVKLMFYSKSSRLIFSPKFSLTSLAQFPKLTHEADIPQHAQHGLARYFFHRSASPTFAATKLSVVGPGGK